VDRVRVGFVGVGAMGQMAHLRNYAELDECEVVAIAELRAGLGRKVAARYGVPAVFGDHEEMLGEVELDAIVASQPFGRHGLLVTELAKAGKPVLTEKPLAACVEAGERIVKALAENETWQFVGYHKRSDPATMHAKVEIDRLKASGELGRMTYVRLSMPPGDWIAGGFVGMLGSDEPYTDLERDPPASDMDEDTRKAYDAFVNYYIHQVNLMRHLLGEPYEVTHADPAGVLLVARSVSGIPATLEMAAYSTTIDWQESALVCFERGWVRIDLPAPLVLNRAGKVTVFRDPGDGRTPVTEEPQMPFTHAMRQQAANFIRAVRSEMAPMTDAAEALEDLRMARDYIRLLKEK
jgi:predicted dehydrogenase